MLSSDMVLNGLVSLKFSSLGIQMPSALHWLVTLPLCHITLRIFQSCWTESWTAFVHAVRYPSWSRGNGWSCCLNDFLDLFQAWILDVQLSCFFWLSTCSLAGITQGVAKEGVNITRPDLPLLLSPSNFLKSKGLALKDFRFLTISFPQLRCHSVLCWSWAFSWSFLATLLVAGITLHWLPCTISREFLTLATTVFFVVGFLVVPCFNVAKSLR